MQIEIQPMMRVMHSADRYFREYELRTPPEARRGVSTRVLLLKGGAMLCVALVLELFAARWFGALELVATLGASVVCLWFLPVREEGRPRVRLPRSMRDIAVAPLERDRPLAVDVLFPTFNEDPELVRLAVQGAKRLRFPHAIEIRIHVLDDGRRQRMRTIAAEECVNYITRSDHGDFKAGNLRHGLEQTHGDLIVICDADARPCSGLLEETLGYFRDPDVAWVQTPQPALEPLEFDDVVHHRSSWCNGSFCCAAGSVHRREALQEAARHPPSPHGAAARGEPRRNWKSVCHPRAVTEHLTSGIIERI